MDPAALAALPTEKSFKMTIKRGQVPIFFFVFALDPVQTQIRYFPHQSNFKIHQLHR